MKKIIGVLAIGLLLISCQTENISENTETSVENLFLQTPKVSFDASEKGIYHGVFSTFDSKLHGEIIINVGNDGNYNAGVKLLNGEKLTFEATNKDLASLRFEGERGSFIFNATEKEYLVASNFLVDGKNGYIKVYKETRGGGFSVLFGAYIDGANPTFTGNWDVLSLGDFEPGSGFLLIQDIVISHNGSMFSDSTAGLLEPFFESCFFSSPFTGGATNGDAISAVDQIATFGGIEAIWNMVGLSGLYFNPITCDVLPFGEDGTWSWNGRSGTIFVLSVPI